VTEDQIFRTWMMLGGVSLVLLFVGALTNKVTVYRDYYDLGWSLSLIFSPIIGGLLIAFIGGDEVDPWAFAKEVLVGQVVLGVSIFVMGLSILKTYLLSMQDNGVVLGLFIGTAKVTISILIAICAISLISYLFRDKRKLGHVAIFFILFGIFGWFVKVLINGERVAILRDST
jgi:hypothetical protein